MIVKIEGLLDINDELLEGVEKPITYIKNNIEESIERLKGHKIILAIITVREE